MSIGIFFQKLTDFLELGFFRIKKLVGIWFKLNVIKTDCKPLVAFFYRNVVELKLIKGILQLLYSCVIIK